MSNQEPKQAPDETVETSPKSLYPTCDSLKQVEEHAAASLPITSKNQLNAFFGMYHNTLLKKLGIKK